MMLFNLRGLAATWEMGLLEERHLYSNVLVDKNNLTEVVLKSPLGCLLQDAPLLITLWPLPYYPKASPKHADNCDRNLNIVEDLNAYSCIPISRGVTSSITTHGHSVVSPERKLHLGQRPPDRFLPVPTSVLFR